MARQIALSDRVKEKARERFPAEEDYSAVCNLLLEYNDGGERGAERIRLDILEISDSSVEKTRELLALAKADFRDLILAAEYTDGPDGLPVLKPQFAKPR